MANPSPIVTVQDGGGGQQATTNGAVVTAGNVVTVTLSSVASVGVWSLTVVGQDDLVTPPVITVNNVAKTATFTAPALPWSLVLQSQVGINSLGKDVNGQTQPSYTTTLGIYCLTAGGARLLATNERAEGSAAYGWITKINTLIRTPGGGGSYTAPTGTGLPHVTAGAQDAAAVHGTVAGQILAVNAGVTDVAFVGVSQDATLAASGALAVVQLTGSAGLVSAVANTALALPGSSGAVASSGDLRVGKTFALKARNSGFVLGSPATANILSLDGSDNLNIGDSSGGATLNVVSITGYQNTGLSATNGNLAFTLYLSGATLKCPSFVLNDSALNITALTFVPVSNGATTQTVAAGVTSFTLGWAPSATAGSPTNVNGQAAGGAGASSGGAVSVLGGAGVNGGTGGAVSISGGAGGASSGLAGAVRLQIKTAGTTVLECAEVVSGNRVLSLCFMSNVTSTQMPANTGDGVVFLANRAIVPSANSVGGGIIYCEAGALKYRGTAGTVTQLGAA